MRGRLLSLAIIAGAVFASTQPGVWNRDYTAWAENDAREIMTHSPWAKEMPMPMSQRGDVFYVDPNVNASAPPSAALGNPANTTSGPNMSSAAGASNPEAATRNQQQQTARTPSMASAPVGAPPVQPTLKVIWASALPVRLAVLKLRSNGNPPTPAQVAAAEKEWPRYVIAVVGLPAPPPGADVNALAPDASLRVRGKPPVTAVRCDYRHIGQSDVYFFPFPKATLPITAADGEVEFKLSTGRLDIRQKFHPDAMQFMGRLAL